MLGIRQREQYRNIGMKQEKGVINSFDKFFEKEKFNTIIEIGTLPGGFALYLLDKAKKMGMSFYTFDVRESKKIGDLLGTAFFQEDVLNSSRIIEMIHCGGRICLMNDGGLKVPTFKKFAPMLKENDCILTHDYYGDRKEIYAGTVTLSEVIQDIENNQLKIYYENLFDQYVWICCMKTGRRIEE